MANICNNTLYATTDDVEALRFIKDFIDDNFVAFSDIDERDCVLDSDFESKWTFPEELMEKMTNQLKHVEDLYIRVLSVEYGCEYVALTKYIDGEWITIV